MVQLLGFGNGSDGEVTMTSHNPIDASATTFDADELSASNINFAPGQFIKVRQERYGSYGAWEINQIQSYNHGTGRITTTLPLANTYSSAGNDRAQVIVMPQYSKVTMTSSFSIKAFNGSVGGHLTFMCSGQVINNAGVTVDGVGRGFRGGDRENSGSPPADAEQGDSPSGSPTRATNNNNLGGGGAGDRNAGQGDHGGGAGHATPGQSIPVVGGDFTGEGGNAIDTTDLTVRQIMGPGGGGGVGPGGNDQGGFGGSGGATFDIYCFEFINNGTINISGNNGNTQSFYGSYTDAGNPNPGGSQGCGGGGGAGGSGRITCVNFTNNGNIWASGGVGGLSNNFSKGRAGSGSDGILAIISCTYINNGSITPSPLQNTGGHSFCSSANQIL